MTLPAYAMNQPSFPEMYERLLVAPLFQPFAEVLIARVAPAAGERVLDVACGTGIVARLARGRVGDTGRVVGVDVSPQMLAVAKSIVPEIEWREGSADALPVGGNEQFDAVTCQQGIQFFADKAAAAREMRRVLAPGGRLAVAAWRPLADNPFVLELERVAERHVGPVVDRRHGFGDATALHALLVHAGFGETHVETVRRTIRFVEGAVFARLNAMALVGMSAGAKEMTDEQRADVAARIAEDSAAVVRSYTGEEGLAFELSTNLAIARG